MFRRQKGRPKLYFSDHVLRQADETLARLIKPNLILPAQAGPDIPWTEDIELRIAILRSAVDDYIYSFRPSGNTYVAKVRKANHAIAVSWFRGDPGAPFSFEECCAAINQHPDCVRRKISLLKASIDRANGRYDRAMEEVV